MTPLAGIAEDGSVSWSNAAMREWLGDRSLGGVIAGGTDALTQVLGQVRETSKPQRIGTSGDDAVSLLIERPEGASGYVATVIRTDSAVKVGGIDADTLFGVPTAQLPASVVSRVTQILNQVVAFVGLLDLDGTLLEANEPALLAAGLSPEDVVGKPFWECYWWSHDQAIMDRLKDAVARAREGEVVRYDSEIRVGEHARLTIDFQLAPLRDESGTIIELIPSGADITQRAAAESARELLMHELSHRVKNTLATVQSIAGHTTRNAADLEDFQQRFRGRLQAMSACHDLLVATEHRQADLRELVERQLEPFDGSRPDAVVVQGEAIAVSGELAHALSMVVHELATNAVKYGALSVPEGSVRVAWTIDGPLLALTWVEEGGPAVSPPESYGFGRTLIERGLQSQFGTETTIDYEPDGLEARFVIDLSRIEPA